MRPSDCVASNDIQALLMVAGMGFEPHDLEVMSLTSYQTALSRHIIFFVSFIFVIILYHKFSCLANFHKLKIFEKFMICDISQKREEDKNKLFPSLTFVIILYHKLCFL